MSGVIRAVDNDVLLRNGRIDVSTKSNNSMTICNN